MDVRSYLKERALLFDGAMGTWFAARNPASDGPCERANLTNPQEIEAIHRAYLAAGCAAIKTNTFAANRANFTNREECEAILRAGWDIAQKAAGGEAFVFADIGPAQGEAPYEEYRFIADVFLDAGAQNFLFETQSRADGLLEAAAHIKARKPDAFVLISFAVQPDGFTRTGLHGETLLSETAADENVDAVGLNCVCGARHMAKLADGLGDVGCPISAMPNAGYPTVRASRTFYDGDPAYFADQLARLQEKGVRILGGCCGTTPAYMAAAAKALAGGSPARIAYPPGGRAQDTQAQAEPVRREDAAHDRFWQALCDPDRKPVAVELDPPENADMTRFMRGARELLANGADLITVADCPIARPRMDASLIACKLRRELGAQAMPHMTCRDRNLNAAQALLLGLCAEEVTSVLIVTGDPVPSASRDEVKSVYQFNSRKLIRYVDSLGKVLLPRPFHIYGALNVNARNFDIQLKLAMEKEEAGACGFFTQPVLTQRALDNLRQARQTLKGKLVGGIIPIVSQRNAQFMNSEVPGIDVDARVIALYEGADRAAGEELALMVSREVARSIAPHVDGFYLMTPFGRTGLMARLMARLGADGLISR